ncbi:MAG: hypothetical protein HYZ16_01800 [Bacteroidetes bacterium]|jgi:membrane-associated phospholipid phosphatase|nr:hypothetical protein [Bacteroidota bacterium]
MRYFSLLVSYALHPLFLFPYLFVVYLYAYPFPSFTLSPTGKLLLSGLMFVLTALVPLVLLRLFKQQLTGHNLPSRRLAVTTVILVYALVYTLFPHKYIPESLVNLLISIVFSLAIVQLAGRRLAISLHATGWGGVIGALFWLLIQQGTLFFYPTIVAVLLAGLVGFSRLYLGAHNNKELYLGYLVGIATTTGVFALLT